MLRKYLYMALRGKTVGLPWLSGQIQHHDARCAGSVDCIDNVGHQHVRNDGGKPRAGAKRDEVRTRQGFEGCGVSGRRLRKNANAAHVARRGGDGDLSADWAHDRRVLIEPGDLGLYVKRLLDDRVDAAMRARETRDDIKRLLHLPDHFRESGDEQVAHGVTGKSASSAKAVLQRGGPQPFLLAVVGEGRQRHAQVSGRDEIELTAQPTGRAAIISDGDDGRDFLRIKVTGGK